MPFIGKQSSANSKIKKYSYTATTNQTNFAVVSGSGDELQVFFNGVKLKETDDYTFSTSQVTLGSPASSGDIVDIHVFSSFLIADAVSSSTGGPLGTGNNEWSLPVTRATVNGQFLQMSDISNGTTVWASTVIDPSITGVTGHLNATEATGEGGGGTLVITGADLGTNISQVTDVSICNSSGGSAVPATTKSLTSSNTEITATWTGNESGYSTFSGVYYVKLTKSGKNSNIFNSTKNFSADPTISSVTGANGDLFSGSVSSSNLGTYGGTIAGGGQDSNTKLLLNFDRTGGTDIEDSSNVGGDGHKVTASGHAVIKASPFGDGRSAIYFDGSSYLEITNHADLQLNDSDFTIEFWMHSTSLASHDRIFGQSTSNKTGIICTVDSSGVMSIQTGDGGSNWILVLQSSSGAIQANVWHHIAIVQSSLTLKFYIDGKEIASGNNTGANNTSVGNFRIGDWEYDTSAFNFNGYLDEFRIVKGTAVYTSDFTVPTSRLTAITNTKLLIHSDLDHVVNQSMAIAGVSDTPTAHGSYPTDAIRFDNGSGEASNNHEIKVNGIDPNVWSGSWTLEGWFWQDGVNESDNGQSLFSTKDLWFGVMLCGADNSTSGRTNLRFHIGSGSWVVNGTQLAVSGSGVTWNTNEWHHVAIVRDGNTYGAFIDGKSIGTISSSHPSYESSINYFQLGTWSYSYDGHRWNGKTNGIRLSKVARYTPTSASYSATFTPETTFHTRDANTVALVSGSELAFKDSATGTGFTTHSITPTGSFHSTGHGGIAPALAWPASQKKTGSAGIYFDGDGDYLTVFHGSFPYGSSTRTFEAWVYLLSLNDAGYHYAWRTGAASDGTSWGLLFRNHIVNNHLDIASQHHGSSYDVSTNVASSSILNTWTHFAQVYDGTNVRLYMNGKLIANSIKSINTTASDLIIGANSTSSHGVTYAFHGYIDGFKISDAVEYSGTNSSSDWSNYLGSSGTTPWNQPTKIYGARLPANPSVGTITITGTTTDSTDIAFTEINNSLPNGLTLTDGGASGATDPNGASVSAMTAHITGTLTDVVSSDTTTSNIRIQAKANNDAKRITEVNESNGVGAVSITKKVGGAPVLFNARRYVGNALAREISEYGFRPDLIWVKNRDAIVGHMLVDSVRGLSGTGGGALESSSNIDADGVERINGFTSDGWTHKAGTYSYSSTANNAFIAWAWKAGGAPSGNGKRRVDNSSTEVSLVSSDTEGANNYHTRITNVKQSVNSAGKFSITKYYVNTALTSPSSPFYLCHGLGGTPDMIIIKDLDNATDWAVWHKSLSSTTTGYLNLNDTGSEGADIMWGPPGYQGHTQHAVSLGDAPQTGRNGRNYIMYAWKAVAGVSAFGSYTGATGGTRVYTTSDGTSSGSGGFRPRWIMTKASSTSSIYASWTIIDAFRSDLSGSSELDASASTLATLYADQSKEENKRAGDGNASNTKVIIYDDGFKFTRGQDETNSTAGWTYIYMAFG